jgi:very-short-patch-repair endonuclease
MKYLPYNQHLKQFSRNLRNNSTLAEILLWNQLKAGKMSGYKFNRQKPIGKYIVDFYCKNLNLVIEVDGSTHDNEEQILKDQQRQTNLESSGLNFLRFRDEDVKKNMNNVLRAIEWHIFEFEKAR